MERGSVVAATAAVSGVAAVAVVDLVPLKDIHFEVAVAGTIVPMTPMKNLLVVAALAPVLGAHARVSHTRKRQLQYPPFCVSVRARVRINELLLACLPACLLVSF
jgi:hypothetical protein